MLTLGKPTAIEPPWAHGSPMRAAGFLPIITLVEPITIESGGAGGVHMHMSPMVAAGTPPIRTFGVPGGMIGPPTCGTVAGPTGVAMGQMCMSPTRAAGGIGRDSPPDQTMVATVPP